MRSHIGLVLAAFVAAGLPAQDPAAKSAPDATRAALVAALAAQDQAADPVVWDRPEIDGPWWVRGPDFKVRFGSDGWTFHPRPAPGAEELSPLHFQLAAVRVAGVALPVQDALPERSAQRVSYHHGAVVQWIDVDARGVEQGFRFDALPARGELVLELDALTALAGHAAADGLVFTGPHDRVTYSRAVAFDAGGARTEVATLLDGGRIVLRVPADFVQRARLPLVVDPRVAVATVSSGGNDHADPDICCHWVTATVIPTVTYREYWGVVFARYFGGSDWDCHVQYFDPDLVAVGGLHTIDISSNGWMRPRIASLRAVQRALVVAQVRGGGLRDRIQARAIADPPNGTPGAVLDISTPGDAVDNLRPDVGGSGAPFLLRNEYFLVVWERAYSGTDHDIYARRVDWGNGLGATIAIQTNTLHQQNPSVSKGCGAWNLGPDNQRFAVVYQQRGPAGDEDIHGSLLTWDGRIVPVNGAATFPIDTSPHNDTWPQVSTPSLPDGAGRQRLLAVYERTSSGNGDIAATCFDQAGTILAQGNVSALENDPVRLGWRQSRPAVDCDGVRFGVAYHEVYQNNTTVNDLDTRMSLVALAGNGLRVQEAGAILGFSGNREFHAQVASTYGANGAHRARYGTANDRDNTNNTFAIDARTCDGVPADTFVTRATGCGSLVLVPVGHPRIGGSVQFVVTLNPYLTGFLVGGAASNPIAGCPGCTLGVNGSTALGNGYTLALPFEPNLIGLPISVQGFVFGASTSPCFGQLMLTDTIDFTVQ